MKKEVGGASVLYVLEEESSRIRKSWHKFRRLVHSMEYTMAPANMYGLVAYPPSALLNSILHPPFPQTDPPMHVVNGQLTSYYVLCEKSKEGKAMGDQAGNGHGGTTESGEEQQNKKKHFLKRKGPGDHRYPHMG